MTRHRFVLAVDGGGSKTEAELTDGAGHVLARARAGRCNLYQDAQAGLAALDAAWCHCCAAAGLDPLAAAKETLLSAALAGAGAALGRAHFHASALSFAGSWLSTDAYASLLGAFDGGPGVLLGIGTGTVACLRDADGRFVRIGGWGFPAGDQGGGAWMGLQLVTAWLQHLDGARPPTTLDGVLWAAAERHVGSGREAILEWLRHAAPADFAGLAPTVLRAAQQGAPLADQILDEAAGHLERLVRALRPGQALPVALGGGLAAALAPRLQSRLERTLALQQGAALRGAWLIAAGLAPPEFPCDARC